MKQTGETEVLYDSLNGKPIGKVNFVIRDSKDRIWITVSTLLPNWMESASSIKRDGFVALADEKGLRIVADGFAFTNEIRLDEKEEWLYIVETTGMKITRMRVLDNGDLVDRETYGPENHGAFIDGIAFDSKGNLWGTHIMTDHIFAILPDGDLTIILDDDKAMYYNYELEEEEFFNPQNTQAWFFFDIFKPVLSEKHSFEKFFSPSPTGM